MPDVARLASAAAAAALLLASGATKAEAESVARNVEGVSSVENNITVQP